MRVEIIRTDGAIEFVEMPQGEIEAAIGADGLCTVNLRQGNRIMICDDTGAVNGRPVNAKATALYHSVCRPGTVWQIRGDVAIIREEP